jgi:hypothetical protein
MNDGGDDDDGRRKLQSVDHDPSCNERGVVKRKKTSWAEQSRTLDFL